MKSNPLRPHQVAIASAALASLVLWAIPLLHWIMLPLKYLNTYLHEISHALVATATGGEVQYINVFADGSGVTPISGGSLWLSASAGYVGAAILGATIMFAARSEKAARNTLRVLFLLILVAMIVWVRGDGVGLGAGVVWLGILAGATQWAKGPKLIFLAQFIGLQQCLNAVQSLYDLLRISAFTEAHSDAKIMEQMTHLPAMFWAVSWCGFSLVMLGLGLRRAWSAASPPSRPAESR